VKSKSLDYKRSFEKFESLAEPVAHQEQVEGEEDLDCDFGLNESEDGHTITENSQEPGEEDTKKINMLI
jgi:hypothetical protein